MRTQCDAVAPASTYAGEHRCLKTRGVQRVGRRRLCRHHRSMKAPGRAGAAA